MSELHFNYINAKQAGYRADICKIGESVYDPLQYWVKANFPDIEITRPTLVTDLSLVHSKTLMTINGYIYPTVYLNSRLFVPSATLSMLKSKANHIGIISFNLLDEPLVKHKLSVEDISPDGNYSLYEKCIITAPSAVRSPILVIGGYMQLEEPGVFYRISDTAFMLCLDKLSYMERLYETMRYRDIFNELEIPTSVNNITMVDAEVAKADSTVLKYLTSFNSFLVDVPVDNLQSKQIYLDQSHIASTFTTNSLPIFPLVTGLGKFSEYQYSLGPDGRYVVSTIDAYYDNFLLSKLNPPEVAVYNAHREVGSTYRLSSAYMLDLFTEI